MLGPNGVAHLNAFGCHKINAVWFVSWLAETLSVNGFLAGRRQKRSKTILFLSDFQEDMTGKTNKYYWGWLMLL